MAEHHEDVMKRTKAARLQNLRSDFLRLAPAAADFLRQLEETTLDATAHLTRITALGEIHGRDALKKAIDTALHFQVCKAEYIEHILSTASRQQPESRGVLHVPNANGQLDLRVPAPDLSRFKTIRTPERNNHG